nr:POR protein [Plantago ovata]
MADAAVEFLLTNLKDLLLYHGKLIANAKDQVAQLEEDLRLFNAFLKATIKKRRRDDSLKELVRQIRDVVYDAEEIIDTFITQSSSKKSSSSLSYFRKPVNLHNIAQQVDAVSKRIKKIYGDKLNFASLNVNDGDPDHEQLRVPIVRRENIVGFEDEAEKLIGYLREEKDQLDVISIIGMPGLGKTTLAGKIFHDPALQYEFPTRIWVYISQEFTRKNIFLAILKELIKVTDDVTNKTEDELAKEVAVHLENGKFLIVMDDVWATTDWEKLKIALPTRCNMGKVLITSRHFEVGRFANRQRDPHRLRFLTEEESWLLLRLEVFGKSDFPSELEPYGRLIVNKCDNLPLAIVVIGGILVKKVSATDDMAATKTAWREVSENVNAFIVGEDSTKRMEKIIALSYDKLPYHLRACFLYLGMFPEDFEIPSWQLTRMWIAEGFIQHKVGFSLEDTAENYLDDLINRNLLRVDKRKRDGKVKTCRIHDMLRDFCKNEAGNENENFLQEIRKTKEGLFDPQLDELQKFRRLCIHSNITNFVSSKLRGERVRSFVCFSKEEINLLSENMSTIPAAFKLLRVLEVKPLRFPRVSNDMYDLIHLRYVSISFKLDSLPQAFTKLWNIQTLIVDTTERTLEIKADIWKMKQLRHLKTNASATLPKLEKGGSTTDGAKIQTLGTISTESCTEAVFSRARNVKKLAVRGRLAVFFDPRNVSLDSLGKLENLEKLKLVNDAFPNPPSEGKVRNLPRTYQFPPKLRSLTLADTFLDWSHMSVLALLECLEVLKLKDKAFMGNTWEAVDGGFQKLEVLYIGRTDLVTWIASKHHYPKLQSLELRNCEELQQVPLKLAEILSFQRLDLYRTTKSAAASAKRIREEKDRMQDGQTTKFKLTIFPPEEVS